MGTSSAVRFQSGAQEAVRTNDPYRDERAR
jgi:hypothetical protein